MFSMYSEKSLLSNLTQLFCDITQICPFFNIIPSLRNHEKVAHGLQYIDRYVDIVGHE